MGLQNWLPSQAALSSMACLDVETPSLCRGKFKSVLHCVCSRGGLGSSLWSRASCHDLQSSLQFFTALKTPAGFHEQIRSLERAKTGTFLKHKLCSRPERSELIRMHILQGSDAQAEASVNASRMNLKRARLADDLNEKISRQPGPRELMEKKILPADSDVEGVLNGERVNSFKAQDVYSFDEDNSDTLSPEEKSSKQETPRSSSSSSLRESEETRVTSSSLQLNSQHSPPSSDKTHSSADLAKLISTNDQQGNTQASAPQPKATVGPSVSPGPVLVKQTLPKLPGDKGRSKKSKEPKPWMKKLKYHQYIPPDQKQEVIEMPMDSAYARLLQQQQQFLQLQILSQQQQQQQHNYTGSLPSTINRTETEVQTSCSGGNAASAQYVHGNHKLYHLPANLDEMKVSELKVELKRRSLPVSGTKTDLIDRLRQYAETSNIQTNTAVEMPASQLTPPVSPIATKVSSLGLEDSSMADTRAVSSQKAPQEEFYPEKSYWKDSTHLSEKDCEKDKRLYEKERQIEELMRKLEQEQRLVEELKMKLKVEKRNQQINTSPRLSPLPPAQIKKETCPTSCSSPALPMLVKQEEAADLGHMSPPDQFIISNQTIKQPETLLSVQAGPQILLPASLPTSAFAIQLPANCIKLNNAVSSAPPGLAQTSGQHPQKTKTPAASQQQSSAHTPPPVENQRMNSAAQNLLGTFPGSSCSTGHAISQSRPAGVDRAPAFIHKPRVIVQRPASLRGCC
ncbi:MKL/myocardin-like protein 2 isoform X2 [Cynoglossus semilaevis]|uniref:MKL/myocardin-like protein 2 isoform X2 n=1 Tax=Cynoglossus semilaevis TaxID=244447 RepID=UPI000D62E76F|nr:MKL/myocardin-like protein 2 isoform X2 [Cynoglossus semilaevis]